MDFRELMQSRGLGPYKIERLTGIRHDKIQKYANGRMFPTLKNLLKLAEVLDCDPVEVFSALYETYKRKSTNNSRKEV